MVNHFFPETDSDTPNFHLKIDIRSDDLAGIKKALGEALKEAKGALTDHSIGCSWVSKPKRKASKKPGRYSMHFLGEWEECGGREVADGAE